MSAKLFRAVETTKTVTMIQLVLVECETILFGQYEVLALETLFVIGLGVAFDAHGLVFVRFSKFFSVESGRTRAALEALSMVVEPFEGELGLAGQYWLVTVETGIAQFTVAGQTERLVLIVFEKGLTLTFWIQFSGAIVTTETFLYFKIF